MSPVLLQPKLNGEYRLIPNLKKFYQYLPYRHFKIETFEITLNLLVKRMYMCSIDIRHAYYFIRVAKEHQIFHKKQIPYQFAALPNGSAHGPETFTLLLKPIYFTLFEIKVILVVVL